MGGLGRTFEKQRPNSQKSARIFTKLRPVEATRRSFSILSATARRCAEVGASPAGRARSPCHLIGMASNRSLPLLARERSGRRAVASRSAANLANIQRDDMNLEGVEKDGSLLNDGGRDPNRFFFRCDPAPPAKAQFRFLIMASALSFHGNGMIIPHGAP